MSQNSISSYALRFDRTITIYTFSEISFLGLLKVLFETTVNLFKLLTTMIYDLW